jgi:hypothetical protein
MKTKDYNKFKLISTNRKINNYHVNKIVKSMLDYGFLNSKPITVNSNFEIIDGQHRYYAAKKLGLDVVYEIDNVNFNDAMVTVNTTSNVWRLNEFIEHYSAKGLRDFIELNDFINNTDYGTSNCISIFCGFSVKPSHIRSGQIPFRNNKILETIELIEFFRDKLKFFKTNKFIESIVILVNRDEVQLKHIQRLKLNAFSIVECANHSQYTAQYNRLMKLK